MLSQALDLGGEAVQGLTATPSLKQLFGGGSGGLRLSGCHWAGCWTAPWNEYNALNAENQKIIILGGLGGGEKTPCHGEPESAAHSRSGLFCPSPAGLADVWVNF